jgi:hypothetical protein
MDLGEIGLGGVDWIRLAQDRDRWQAVVSAVMNIRVLAPRISYITWRMSNWPVGGRSSETQSHHIYIIVVVSTYVAILINDLFKI